MRDVQTVVELHLEGHHLPRHPNRGHSCGVHPGPVQEQPDPSGEGQGAGHLARRAVGHAQGPRHARPRLLLRRRPDVHLHPQVQDHRARQLALRGQQERLGIQHLGRDPQEHRV